MALVKYGTEMPVISYYDQNGVKEVCPDCGKLLTVVVLDDNDTILVCEYCIKKEIKQESR